MRVFGYLAAFACGLALSGGAYSQDTSGKEVLQRAADYAGNLTKWTADFEILFDAEVDEEIETFTTDYTVAMRRPGDAMVHMNNRYMEMWFYTTATETTRYLPEVEQYLVEPKGSRPSDLVLGASNNVILPSLAILAELMNEKPFAEVLGNENPVTLVGEETVNGVVCDRVRFQYADFSCDIWVGQDDKALVHRVLPDMSGMTDALAEQGMDVKKFVVQLNVLLWQPNAVEDLLLAYTPAEGVEKVAQFYQPQPESAASEMVGKVAPAVDLKLMDGESFDLASKKDKEIVVLDFWATWCGPCRMGMPILSKVTKEFADKGVRMYAVNLREGLDQINPFLESTGLDLTIVMDTEGAMADAYGVESIPQMVIIGRDGLIKKVHIGITPNYEDDVRAELTELTQE